jgi:hypothetical protein
MPFLQPPRPRPQTQSPAGALTQKPRVTGGASIREWPPAPGRAGAPLPGGLCAAACGSAPCVAGPPHSCSAPATKQRWAPATLGPSHPPSDARTPRLTATTPSRAHPPLRPRRRRQGCLQVQAQRQTQRHDRTPAGPRGLPNPGRAVPQVQGVRAAGQELPGRGAGQQGCRHGGLGAGWRWPRQGRSGAERAAWPGGCDRTRRPRPRTGRPHFSPSPSAQPLQGPISAYNAAGARLRGRLRFEAYLIGSGPDYSSAPVGLRFAVRNGTAGPLVYDSGAQRGAACTGFADIAAAATPLGKRATLQIRFPAKPASGAP